MKENKLVIIDKLIKENKIDEAQFELSKMGTEFHKNANFHIFASLAIRRILSVEQSSRE